MKNEKADSPLTGGLGARPGKRRFRGRHLLIVLLVGAVGFGLYRDLRGRKANPTWLSDFAEKIFSKKIGSRPEGSAAVHRVAIGHVILHCGDTPDEVFSRLHIAGAERSVLSRACISGPLAHIRDNDELFVVFNGAQGQPERLVYVRSGGGAYVLRKEASGWRWVGIEKAVSVQCAWSKSFYHSCVACGLPEPLIEDLAGIFSYDLDVSSDLKAGDRFSVFYESYPIESSGEKRFLVLGAQMEASGKVYEATGLQLADGSWDYFDAGGQSLKRPFVRVPLDYRSLLTGDEGRVLKILLPHYVVMYIVPAGARVCAVGDGVVSAVHRSSGRRYSIEIRHEGGYMSRYGNLSACSRGLVRGAPVRRSMVIGSAASYGSAKGYFDFQFYRYGKPVNFGTTKFAPLRSAPGAMAAAFAKSRAACMAVLRSEAPTDNKLQIPCGKK